MQIYLHIHKIGTVVYHLFIAYYFSFNKTGKDL